MHIQFLVVVGGYTYPSPDWVLLFLERKVTDVSLVPLLSAISHFVIRCGDALPVPMHFKFRSGISIVWREWVDQELSDVGFIETLQRVGVLKAILSSRSLQNFRD